jgi:hypothetical protein
LASVSVMQVDGTWPSFIVQHSFFDQSRKYIAGKNPQPLDRLFFRVDAGSE